MKHTRSLLKHSFDSQKYRELEKGNDRKEMLLKGKSDTVTPYIIILDISLSRLAWSSYSVAWHKNAAVI